MACSVVCVAVGSGVFVGVDVAGMMVILGGGRVGVEDAGADAQAERVMQSRKIIRVVRGIRELYQQGQSGRGSKEIELPHDIE